MTVKIKTNLGPSELLKASRGLKKAAAKQQRPYKPENNAEAELLRNADNAFDTMLNSLQEEFAAVLLGKDTK